MIKIFRDKELLKGLGGSADYILETIENDTNLKEDVQKLNLKIFDFQGIRRSYITTFCIASFLILGPIMFFKVIMAAIAIPVGLFSLILLGAIGPEEIMALCAILCFIPVIACWVVSAVLFMQGKKGKDKAQSFLNDLLKEINDLYNRSLWNGGGR